MGANGAASIDGCQCYGAALRAKFSALAARERYNSHCTGVALPSDPIYSAKLEARFLDMT